MYDLREIRSPEATDDLFALTLGSSSFVNLYTDCVINDVKWLTYARDCRRNTQNNGVFVPGIER